MPQRCDVAGVGSAPEVPLQHGVAERVRCALSDSILVVRDVIVRVIGASCIAIRYFTGTQLAVSFTIVHALESF